MATRRSSELVRHADTQTHHDAHVRPRHGRLQRRLYGPSPRSHPYRRHPGTHHGRRASDHHHPRFLVGSVRRLRPPTTAPAARRTRRNHGLDRIVCLQPHVCPPRTVPLCWAPYDFRVPFRQICRFQAIDSRFPRIPGLLARPRAASSALFLPCSRSSSCPEPLVHSWLDRFTGQSSSALSEPETPVVEPAGEAEQGERHIAVLGPIP